jgi:hypothetical protein
MGGSPVCHTLGEYNLTHRTWLRTISNRVFGLGRFQVTASLSWTNSRHTFSVRTAGVSSQILHRLADASGKFLASKQKWKSCHSLSTTTSLREADTREASTLDWTCPALKKGSLGE